MAVLRRLIFLALLMAVLSWPFPGRGQTGARNGEWRAYSAEEASTRYSPVDQITRDNVKNLEVAWTWKFDNYGSAAQTATTETTPLMVGGKLFFTAGQRRTVVAADAGTGETIWTWRPDEGARFDAAPRKVHRGVAYWTSGQDERIVVVTPGFQLVSLDAKTGRPVSGFGQTGVVDLFKELDNDSGLDPTGKIGNSSPPVISNDVIVVGPALTPGGRVNIANVKADIMGFDVRTGRKLWTFHTIPREGEPGFETWLGDSAQYTGNAGIWGPFSADPALGYVYLSIESATNDVYGGHRPGNNLYSGSLVCLDIKTGKMIWYQQLVHHDIWDYDMPPHPILVDLNVDGKPVKAVVQFTKQAFAYVFDRTNGRPVWPLVERPVPQTDVPGEWTSPTQPFPSKPPAFDAQGITHDDLIDFTPELRAEAIKAIEQFKIGPIYTPGTLVVEGKNRGTIIVPGLGGGANWPSGAADPETGFLYVGSTTTPGLIGLSKNNPQVTNVDSDYMMGGQIPTIQGLRLMKPPYGRITAYDMNKGEIAWQIPNGDTPPAVKNNPALKGLTIPRTGSPSQAGLLVTKTMLFAGEGAGGQPFFHAYDKATGAEIWQTPIPGPQTSLPMTYLHQGRQFVVVGVRGPTGSGAQLIAFALPREEPAGRGGRGGRAGGAGRGAGANTEK
ncbi:MAG TPA: PQQ-binding-like beta-propeller repeat protein [Vicinamibacterales bacterium]|nr:PQQ-binding-like beta-propeller repeat protein [Vicinamibacterales bacterium]